MLYKISKILKIESILKLGNNMISIIHYDLVIYTYILSYVHLTFSYVHYNI